VDREVGASLSHPSSTSCARDWMLAMPREDVQLPAAYFPLSASLSYFSGISDGSVGIDESSVWSVFSSLSAVDVGGAVGVNTGSSMVGRNFHWRGISPLSTIGAHGWAALIVAIASLCWSSISSCDVTAMIL